VKGAIRRPVEKGKKDTRQRRCGDEIQEPETGWGKSRISNSNRPCCVPAVVGWRPFRNRDGEHPKRPQSMAKGKQAGPSRRLHPPSKAEQATAARRSCFFGLPQMHFETLTSIVIEAPKIYIKPTLLCDSCGHCNAEIMHGHGLRLVYDECSLGVALSTVRVSWTISMTVTSFV
jgi:hypothetical protein